MTYDPKAKLPQIRDKDEHRAMQSLMDIIDNNFGLDFIVVDGHVVTLQMAAAGLVVIPRQIQAFSHLTALELPANKIRRLKNIDLCQSLRLINLSNNAITTQGLHKMNNCNSLQKINLSMNEIDSMEPLSGMKNLERLDLSNNHIAEIAYIDLPMLRFLNLLGNPILKLENLHFFKNLEVCRISGKSLPPEEQALLQSQSIKEIQDYCRNE